MASAQTASTGGGVAGSVSGATKNFNVMLDTYQKARLQFAQSIADFAARESNLEHINANDVLPLLRPLLTDTVPGIQHAAALALGRLANFSEAVAWNVVNSGILPHLVFSIQSQNVRCLPAIAILSHIPRHNRTLTRHAQRFYKKSATFVLRSIARHSVELARAIADTKGIEALIFCLEDFDPGVKESAGWALGYIARHSQDLASNVVDAGAIPLLVTCIQEPELSLRRIAASALGDIAKHSPELAQSVFDGNSIHFLSPLLATNDGKLKRQVCATLAQIAKHTVDLAESVVDGDIFPKVLHCLKDADGHVRKHAATLICEIVKHSPELAQLVVNSGGVAAVVDYTNEARGTARLPGIMTLGYIAAFSETLAFSVIVSKGVPPLTDALTNETEEHVKAACAWSLGQIGRHSPDHAKTLSDHAVLPKLLKVLMFVPSPSGPLRQQSSSSPPSPQKPVVRAASPTAAKGATIADTIVIGPLTPLDDLRIKTKRALKCILEKTLHLESLDPLVQLSTPPNILRYVLAQFAKILPHDIAARRAFVTTGCLQRVQEILAAYKAQQGQVKPGINADDTRRASSGGVVSGNAGMDQDKDTFVGSKLYEHIRLINDCYPEEIVRYYSPGYSNILLGKIEEYGRTQGDANSAGKNREMARRASKMPPSDIPHVAVTPVLSGGGAATEVKERAASTDKGSAAI